VQPQPSLNEPNALDASIERAGRHHQQLLDGMTKLPGPALLIDRTRVAIARAGRSQRTVAVIVFDEVRRADGHSQDFVTFVDLLRRSVRADDTVARLSGLTFVVVLNDISDPDRPARVAQRLLQSAGVQCRLGISLGTAPTSAEELLSIALREARAPLGGTPEPEPERKPWPWEVE
jgi:GGDEF domain-containing protein